MRLPASEITGTPGDPERILALSYAPARMRGAVSAVFALDAQFAQILRSTTQQIVGQMRLTWWYEALTRLDDAPPPAQPLLRALAENVLPLGVTGAALAELVDGWEALLDPETPDAETLEGFAARGITLFGIVATLLGTPPGDPVAPAGRGWALADLARHVSDPAVAARALDWARGPLAAATAVRWSRQGRALGALAHLAAMDVAVPLDRPIARGAPRRIARILRHRLTGR